MDTAELILNSLQRRVKALHSLWIEAIETMDIDQVNHVERSNVLPIAFSLFHFVEIEDGSTTLLGGPDMIFDPSWALRMDLGVPDHGKEKSVEEMMNQRIGDYEEFTVYTSLVFEKTESWLRILKPDTLLDVIVGRPIPEVLSSTFSARVAGEEGITRLDGIECWIYQHGLRHMGEIEHARSLVGLGGMTS